METRRRFLTWIASVLGVGAIHTASAPTPPTKEDSRRFFRQDAKDAWREIAFESIEAGDRLLIMDLKEGHLERFEAVSADQSPYWHESVKGMVFTTRTWQPILTRLDNPGWWCNESSIATMTAE